MKKYILLSISALLFIVTNCTKEENPGMPVYFPKPGSPDANVMAVRGWQSWGAFGYAQVHNDRPTEYFGMKFNTYTEEGFKRERIYLNEIPLKPGVYEVRKTVSGVYDGYVGSSYATLQDDGDVLGAYFELDESASSNELEITFIDTIAGVVRGTFNLNFIRRENESNPNPLYPDKIRFRNGVFEVKFFE